MTIENNIFFFFLIKFLTLKCHEKHFLDIIFLDKYYNPIKNNNTVTYLNLFFWLNLPFIF